MAAEAAERSSHERRRSTGQERLDHGSGQRSVDELSDPGFVVGPFAVGRGRQPAPAALDEDVRELGDRHREVRRVLDLPGTARLRVRGADDTRPPRIRAVLDEDQRELLGRVRQSGIVEVEDAEAAVSGAPDVVGPEVAVTGSERARRAAEERLHGDQLRDERIELIGERGVIRAERADELGPPRRPDRFRVPGVDADRAGEVDAVEAGDQPPNGQRIEVRIRVVKLHPGVEPDPHLAAVGDVLTRARASHRRRRDAGGERRLLKRRALEQFGQLTIGDIADLFERPAARLGIQPPDRAEPPARDGSVRESPPRPEVERREDRRNMTVVERGRQQVLMDSP